MRSLTAMTAAGLIALSGVASGPGDRQASGIRALDEKALREYTGVYRWDDNTFGYLQMWNEFSGFAKPSQLVVFDESGEVRVMNPSDRDEFFTGPGAAISTSAWETALKAGGNRDYTLVILPKANHLRSRRRSEATQRCHR
jgi:hypothetical protein